jgi:hypothetical protein
MDIATDTMKHIWHSRLALQNWSQKSWTLGKRASIALSLLVAYGCSSSCGPCWQGESVIGAAPAFGSARIFLAPLNGFNGLELEFVNGSEGLNLYLNVFGLEIPADPYDGESSRVYISFKDHSYTFSARRFVGGQRLLIPLHVQNEIISYLQQDQPVFIQVSRYQANIYPNEFMQTFKRML